MLLGALTAWLPQLCARAIALRPVARLTALGALGRLCWAWASRWLVTGALVLLVLRWAGDLPLAGYFLSFALCTLVLALMQLRVGRDAPAPGMLTARR